LASFPPASSSTPFLCITDEVELTWFVAPVALLRAVVIESVDPKT
jgi:hypothetical protein